MKKRILNRTYTKGEKIQRINESSFDSAYNNVNDYIYSDDTNIIFDTNILNEFPEKLAGWNWVITNTGLTCFYNDSTQVIYDMFDDSEIGTLENIKPDISMMLKYNFIDQPLNVRKVNFECYNDNNNVHFLPDLKYYYNNDYCVFLNCDEVQYYDDESDKEDEDGETISRDCILSNNSYFKRYDESSIEKIYYNYKPVFVFRVYKTNGSSILSDTDEITITINGEADIVNHYKDNVYYADISDFKNINNKISISLTSNFNGFMEVI